MRVPGPTPKSQAHTVTNVGYLMLARIAEIRKGIYVGAEPNFTPPELEALSNNVTKLARAQLPRAHGLRSEHVKALVAVARSPGIVLRSLLQVYSPETVGLLIARDLVGCVDPGIDPASRYLPVHPLTGGLTILNWCLNQIRMEGE